MSGSEGSLRSKETDIGVPAARWDGLLIEPVGDETVIYDTDSKQAHCLKPLAAIVFGCCDGHATVGEIASAAQRRLGDDVGEAHVVDAVAQLESLGLLQTALVIRPGGGLLATNGRLVSRREMLRRVGFAGTAAAVGTPLVTTISAPNAFAASGLPNGCAGCTVERRLPLGPLLSERDPPEGELQPGLLRRFEQLVSCHELRLQRRRRQLPSVALRPWGQRYLRLHVQRVRDRVSAVPAALDLVLRRQ